MFDPGTGSGQGLGPPRAPWGQAGLPDGGKEKFRGSFPAEEPRREPGSERRLLAGLGLPRTAWLLLCVTPRQVWSAPFVPGRLQGGPVTDPSSFDWQNRCQESKLMLTKANWDAELVGGGVGSEPERRRRVPGRLLPPPVNRETRKQPTRGLGSRLSSSLRRCQAWILSPSFQTRQTGAFLDLMGCQAEFMEVVTPR